MCYLWPYLGPPLAALLCTSGFVDDVVFSHNNEGKCRYNWHSAGSLGWLFLVVKYKYISQIKYTEAIIISDCNRKLLWFEITEMLMAVLECKFIGCHL